MCKTIFMTMILGFGFITAPMGVFTPAVFAEDIPAGLEFKTGAEISYEVVHVFNAQIIGKTGEPVQLVTRETPLRDAEVTVDDMGTLILKVTNGHEKTGYVQILPNSSVTFEEGAIEVASGEAVFWKVPEAVLVGGMYRVVPEREPLSGYFFYRGGDSFFSISFREKEVAVSTLTGASLVLQPGQTVKTSAGAETKVHRLVPSEASKAMRELSVSAEELIAEEAVSASIKITESKGAKLAVESVNGLSYRPLSVGEVLPLRSKFEPLVVALADAESTLKFESRGVQMFTPYEYAGEGLLKIYAEHVKDGSVA